MPFVAFLLNQVVASSPFQSGAGWLFARKNTGGTITTGADRNSLERISLFMGQRSHLIAWMGKHWPRLLVGMSMAALVAMAAVSAGPLRSAIEIGGDEHCEVTKGFLWAKGYSLYEKVWSDQPPLYTALLGTLFQYFGATIGVARSLAVGFGFLLLTGCFVLVKQGGGLLGAYVAAACLLGSPQVLQMSVSAMQEVPAIGTALWALWSVRKWVEQRRWLWLTISAGILAVAMQIKLTAAFLAPALAMEILLGSQGARWADRAKDAVRTLAFWIGCLAGVFLMISVVLGGDYNQIWKTHFMPAVQAFASLDKQRVFSLGAIWEHKDAFWGAGSGLLVLGLRGNWRGLVFPGVLFVTVVAIHLHHRPWWDYYYLHIALPMAWLTGHGVGELFRAAWETRCQSRFRPSVMACGSALAALALVSQVAIEGGTRLTHEINRLRDLPRVEDNALVAKMKEYAERTKWVYTINTIYPFHAKLPVIPELAVISFKRHWSGQITSQRTWTLIKQYQPQQLLVAESLSADEQQFVNANYSLVYADTSSTLYVSKSLMGK